MGKRKMREGRKPIKECAVDVTAVAKMTEFSREIYKNCLPKNGRQETFSTTCKASLVDSGLLQGYSLSAFPGCRPMGQWAPAAFKSSWEEKLKDNVRCQGTSVGMAGHCLGQLQLTSKEAQRTEVEQLKCKVCTQIPPLYRHSYSLVSRVSLISVRF